MAGAGDALALHWVLMAETPSVERRGNIPDRDDILPDVENTPDRAVEDGGANNSLETITGMFSHRYISYYEIYQNYLSLSNTNQ